MVEYPGIALLSGMQARFYGKADERHNRSASGAAFVGAPATLW